MDITEKTAHMCRAITDEIEVQARYSEAHLQAEDPQQDRERTKADLPRQI